ncbi:hypothetical protein ABEB36_003927 [Hypothenemus hampei]|uniref:Cathepsin L n=1 Tax=Hypothenemus hampei TaxID=57062 RepID=A0ABD1F1M0_HYPHA
MKAFLFALLVVAASASLERLNEFEAFKLKHSKTYGNELEESARYAIFLTNVLEIEQHNALYEQGLVTYEKGVNQFTDWTAEEFKNYLTLHPKPPAPVNATKYVIKNIEVPSSIDWRTQGYVTSVKDQGQCGSCWAFSVTGVLEGAYYKKTGNLVSFSEQQLIDCDTKLNYGCDGGYEEQTFPYVQEYGIEAESSYPYTAKDGSCKYDASKVVTKISSYVYYYGNEAALLEAAGTIGPISIAVDASEFSAYSSGIYSSTTCSKKELNHAILVVGYGSENGVDYWIVKNSWGSDWGEEGYIKMRRGVNQCGIAEDVTYPIV